MQRLDKELGLFDVYAIATGAMFSSGFFLLPGLAAAGTGSSVALAYVVSGILIIPAMLAVAELATAMPRAGGAYFFLDRAMGPLAGTVGGLGTWVALVLKTAFALIGMGAYIALVVDVSIVPVAVALTVAFGVLNVIGAKESSGLQRILVTILVLVLAWFLVEGAITLFTTDAGSRASANLDGFLTGGLGGFFATVGLVFVSYAGLTKVASVAEEVRDPDRNLPLGMGMALATAAFVYGGGVLLMNAFLPAEAFHSELTPVAAAGSSIFQSVPANIGLGLVVAAAIAAFASTGNAGIMSSSRYPLAMARDRLLPDRFAKLGRFGTPTLGVVVTVGAIVLCITAFDVSAVAKLASAFQLLLFALLNLAVLVMRESHIASYRPGFRMPLYPWLPVFGLVTSLWLIAQMGALAMTFTAGIVALCVGWYFAYARKRVERTGAIFHVFERLGRKSYRGLDQELRQILHEKGLTDGEPFEEMVQRAVIVDVDETVTVDVALELAARTAVDRFGVSYNELLATIRAETATGLLPAEPGVLLPDARLEGLKGPELVMVRLRRPTDHDVALPVTHRTKVAGVQAILMLLGPDEHTGAHLHLLARLADHVARPGFLVEWSTDRTPAELRRTVLGAAHHLDLEIGRGARTEHLIGRRIDELPLPAGATPALLSRDDTDEIPRPQQILGDGDKLTIIAHPEVLRVLHHRYVA